MVCISLFTLSPISQVSSSFLFSKWWNRPLLKTNWDRLSSLGFITGTWYPIFPMHPIDSFSKKEEKYSVMKDMLITVFENKTLQVHYKGSILEGHWDLLHSRPFSKMIPQNFHSILIDNIRCIRPPAPQYWLKLATQFRWAERLNKTGLRIDFPVLPYLLVSPVPSSLLPLGVGAEMVYDTTEDVGGATLWGYWSCGDKRGKVYLVPVHE